jgi:predicted TIM-barrel fold metal-dependent hydrolase
MRLTPRNKPQALVCDDVRHVHSGTTCCSRRKFLGGLAALGAGTLSVGQPVRAQAPAAERPFRIDTHHHLSSPGFITEIAGRRTGQVPLMQWTVAKSIDDMDQGGVATSILSISEPGVFFGNYDAARALARECNEFGAKVIADHPGRFGMFAIVPMPDVENTLREIAYALDTLKLDGICMMTDYQGKFLGDAAFTPVMQDLNRRKAVVFTHPYRNDCCRNLIPDVPEPVVELGTDTARTIASLLFSGTAARFPDIQWVFSHAGGTAPALMQRFNSYFDARKDLQSRLPLGPSHYMEQFCYDTASATTIYPLAALTKLVKPSQILFGTDYPFGPAKAVAAGLRAVGLFSAADLLAIERGNAARIMPRYRT